MSASSRASRRQRRHRRLLQVRQHRRAAARRRARRRARRQRGVLADQQQDQRRAPGPRSCACRRRSLGDRRRREVAEPERAVRARRRCGRGRAGGGRSRRRAAGAGRAHSGPTSSRPSSATRRPLRAPSPAARRRGGRRRGRRRDRRCPAVTSRGHAHAGPLGEQRDEPLVLDELEAAEAGRALRRRGTTRAATALASSWASHASRPYTLTCSGPSCVGAVEQHDALPAASPPARGRRRRPRARASASLIRDVVGRPPGEPTTRWTIGGGEQCRRRSPRPRRSAAPPRGTARRRAEPTINQRPKWRNGRLRCGDAVERTAVDTTTTAGGNTGGPLTSKSRLMTLRSSSTTSAAMQRGSERSPRRPRRGCHERGNAAGARARRPTTRGRRRAAPRTRPATAVRSSLAATRPTR